MSHINAKPPSIVIFGRTNVGKSTLFNTLREQKQALVSDEAGTTRDSNRGLAGWQGKKFELIDTGGIIDLKALEKDSKDQSDIDRQVQKQAKSLLETADLVLFLVDARSGLLPQDKELARYLLKNKAHKQKTKLVVNKADNPRLRAQAAEFNRLGLGEPIVISAASGSGTGDLLDEITKNLPDKKNDKEFDVFTAQNAGEMGRRSTPGDCTSVAIIGKPNVGKSSLINALLQEEKRLVSPIPHTTREPHDEYIEYRGRTIRFIDTAGISRQGRKSARRTKDKTGLEKFSIEKSLAQLRRADIAVLLIDIAAEMSRQEAKLVEEAVKTKTGLILAGNKWDLIENKDQAHYTEEIRSRLPFAAWAPVIFLSAKNRSKIKALLETVVNVAEERKKELSDSQLAKFLSAAVKRHSPPRGRGAKAAYIYSLKQTGSAPPVFCLRLGMKMSLDRSYIKYLENRLRGKFGFTGNPITIYIDKEPRVHGKHKK